jgi:hypothetical protein
MSMETHVFFRGALPNAAQLQQTMQDLGFPFTIDEAVVSLEEQNGYMPMLRGDEETGVEFDVYTDREDFEAFDLVGVDRKDFERIANFRWGGDFGEAVAALCSAAALAKLVGGVVYDEAEDRLMNVEEAVALAHENLRILEEGTY